MSEPLREEILSRRAAREAGRASPPSAHVDGARPDTTQHSPVRTRRRAQANGSAGPLVAELLSRLKSRRAGQLGAGLQARLSEVEHRAQAATSQTVMPAGVDVAPHEGAPAQLKLPEQERDEGGVICGAPPEEALDTSAGLATPDPARDANGASRGTNSITWAELARLADDSGTADDAGDPNDASGDANLTGWAKLARWEDDSDTTGDADDASPGTLLGHA